MIAPAQPVIFFDLQGTVLVRAGNDWGPAPTAVALLDATVSMRRGILCNLMAGRSRKDVIRLLESANLAQHFDPDLVVVATDLPTPLPDRRAFAVAAALAEVPVGECLFAAANLGLLVAAAAAGMRTVNVAAGAGNAPGAMAGAGAGPPAVVPTLLAAGAPQGTTESAVLLAGEVDEDTGPTFVLKGRVVTMDGRSGDDGVITSGWVAVRKGVIAAVGAASEALPAPFAAAAVIATGGTIYPGLMDLHNHLAYNVLPLWPVPKLYKNRSQWPRHEEYAPQVQLPINILGAYAPTARSIVRYIESKALIGGTTTGQGVRSRQGGMTKLYRGAMRNIEQTDDTRLPEAGSKVLNYKRGDVKDTNSFKAALAKFKAYFYHLSEGTDNEALSHFTDLVQNDLIDKALVGIHSLGLTPANLRTLAQRGAKVVWSPFSNLLLYGKTLDLAAVKDSGVLFSLGCDWAPTGSKNLLEELKVAHQVSKDQGNVLSPEELVRAVTVQPTQILGWAGRLGTVAKGMFADLLVIAGDSGDPYLSMINATEEHVSLVTVHGTPRYGDAGLMAQFPKDPAHPVEALKIGGKDKALYHFSANSPLNDLSLAEATKLLNEAMADLPAFKDRSEKDTANLLAFGMESIGGFALELDNEYDEAESSPAAMTAASNPPGAGPTLLAGQPKKVAQSVELDGLEVNAGTYWDRVAAQKNIGTLGQVLKDAYT